MANCFNVISRQNGGYTANSKDIFSAFHCFKGNADYYLYIQADSSLNHFFQTAYNAFKQAHPFFIDQQPIHDKSELKEWISESGSPDFQSEMLQRFKNKFPDVSNEKAEK